MWYKKDCRAGSGRGRGFSYCEKKKCFNCFCKIGKPAQAQKEETSGFKVKPEAFLLLTLSDASEKV